MKKIILLKFGEVVLKGQNKGYFEKLLLACVRRAVAPCGDFDVYAMQSTGYVEPKSDAADTDAAYEACKKVFGVVALSLTAVCEKDMDAVCAAAADFLGDALRGVSSFKVEAKRADKSFIPASPGICAAVGQHLLEAFPHLRVDVTAPQLTVNVEIRDRYACVHGPSERGAGGMPVGSNGRGLLLISGGIDSPVAGYMMARRGMVLEGVHYFSHPYTSERAKEKVFELVRRLTAWCGPVRLHVVPFTEIQEAIRANCAEEYFTLVMRCFMMRIAQTVALEQRCGALITGESLGQVASQTLEALNVTDSICSLPVFRPVIGMDKEEIVAYARKIDTFDVSVLPYEDCCTVFTPRHPKTKPRIEAVEREYARLDADALIGRALAGIETVYIRGKEDDTDEL